MVFLLHNHPMSYISLVLSWVNVTATSVNCESKISQHNKFCPSKANPLLLYPPTLVYINHHLKGLRVLINSRRPVSYQHITFQFKNKNHTKSCQTSMHTNLGCPCVLSFLSWMSRLCCNHLTPSKVQLCVALAIHVCSSSPLTGCWDITFICMGRPLVTNLAVELTSQALMQAVELQWSGILLHSPLHCMLHPLLYNSMVPKGYLWFRYRDVLQFSQHLRTRNLMIYLWKSALNPSQTEQQIVKSSFTIWKEQIRMHIHHFPLPRKW